MEAFGIEAWQANRKLVEGKEVRLERDVSETDKYGRLLRYVWVDGTLVNAELVRQGLAEAKAYPPDTKYQDYLEQMETEAREAGRGIWARK
ncbi:thermonuclease family protein [Chloroflexota bacterium]